MEVEFGFGKQVNLDFDAAIDKVTADLQTEGFGVLSDIDVAAPHSRRLQPGARGSGNPGNPRHRPVTAM
jgi:hypothetical protein